MYASEEERSGTRGEHVGYFPLSQRDLLATRLKSTFGPLKNWRTRLAVFCGSNISCAACVSFLFRLENLSLVAQVLFYVQ